MSRPKADQPRRDPPHPSPVGPDRQCAVHDEQWLCAAVELLDEMEEVETAARKLHDQLQGLRAERDALQAKAERAIRELSGRQT